MARKVKAKTETVIEHPVISGSFAVERSVAKSVAYTSSIVGTGSGDQNIIYPDPLVNVLFHHTTHNNTLLQCISCMEVNIDGTGFHLLNLDGSEADKNDPEYKDVAGFFSEVYPQVSFISLRRTLRANQESVGWSGMEVLRSLDGKLKFLRAIDVCKFFYLTLPPPMQGTLTVTRNGKVTSVAAQVRPRGMVSVDEGVKQYHSIYGSGVYIDRETGEWGANIPQARRGTEIVIFGAIDNPFSPYHTPRWINQSPSVTGSREAEQLNLEFFESGGIPPLLVTVSGGALGKKTKEALEKFLNTDKKKQYRAAVLETYATGGSLEGSPGSVNVKVESFGSQQQRDSLFENYDAKCEARIRSAFRLPPLLVGRAADFTYATAYASYVVAEAQVFQPERDEFDTIINSTIMRELSEKHIFKSRPLWVMDISNQLKAIEISKDMVDKGSLIDSVNKLVGLSMKVSDVDASPDIPDDAI